MTEPLPLWTVTRTWHKVRARNVADAIDRTKRGILHDQVEAHRVYASREQIRAEVLAEVAELWARPGGLPGDGNYWHDPAVARALRNLALAEERAEVARQSTRPGPDDQPLGESDLGDTV